MNDKKIMNSKSIQSKKLEEVRREDVCTVPEALHYMFFGLEPGSEYDVRLANKLISDLVNQCKTSVWYKEKNLEWGINLNFTKVKEAQKNCPFCFLENAIREGRIRLYEKVIIGNADRYYLFDNFLNFNFYCSSMPLHPLPYRLTSAARPLQNYFIYLQDLKKIVKEPYFADIWKDNKDNPLKKSKNDAETIFDKLKDWNSNLVYNTLNSIYENGNLVEENGSASADLLLTKETFPIIKVLHEASTIYAIGYARNSKKIYFDKDDNFLELRSLVRQYQVLKNPKKYEFDLELEIRLREDSVNSPASPQLKNELILKHKDDKIFLKNISKMPYHFLSLLIAFPNKSLKKSVLNTIISLLYEEIGEKDECKTIEYLNKKLKDALRISDKQTSKRVKNICKMYGKESLSDLLFKIVGDSIAYIPFKKR